MARTRLLSINGSNGEFISISATQITRRIEIIEDFAANAGIGQGLSYRFEDGTATPFSTIYSIAPESEPLILGEPIPQTAGYGPVIGHGADHSGGQELPATLLVQLRSATATATTVRITEFD